MRVELDERELELSTKASELAVRVQELEHEAKQHTATLEAARKQGEEARGLLERLAEREAQVASLGQEAAHAKAELEAREKMLAKREQELGAVKGNDAEVAARVRGARPARADAHDEGERVGRTQGADGARDIRSRRCSRGDSRTGSRDSLSAGNPCVPANNNSQPRSAS